MNQIFAEVFFYATGFFPNPLKISENLWFPDVFRGFRKKLVA